MKNRSEKMWKQTVVNKLVDSKPILKMKKVVNNFNVVDQ
jgi:hypothetical protein